MREQLYQRLLEASDRFAGELTDLVMVRVDQLVAQAIDAFEIALSAFASELSVTDGAARRHDVRDEGGESRPATQPRSRVISPARDARSARGSRGGRKNALPIRTSSAPMTSQRREPDSGRDATNVPSSNRALQQGQDLPPSTSSRTTTNLGGEVADAAAKQTPSSDPPAKTRICGCGPRGPHRRGCSMPNISTSPASSPQPALTHTSSPATSPISATSTRSDRFAKIEAAKAQRELAKRDRDERARAFIRRDGVRPTTGLEAVDVDDAAGEAGSLEPVATFEF